MTRDAKIGLLLGLVFIFIIAFIINGLPGFRGGDGNELTRSMAKPNRSGYGIGTDARRIAQRTITPITPKSGSPDVMVQTNPMRTEAAAQQEQVRFQAELPQPAAATDTKDEIEAMAETVQPQPVLTAARQAQKTETNKAEREPLLRARIYTVLEGDNLASIAKKFYGEQIGDRQATIEMLFKANRKLLKSPDMIYAGQKLIVPPLTGTSSAGPQDVLKAKEFETAESVGKRHLTPKTQPADKTRYYTVKEGDCLWKIAAEQLGDGGRYPELAKLNKLEDEDFLIVGARLKLP